MQRFDLAVIGGGPAGYLAAEKAAEGGLAVVLFEKETLGGVCLRAGCIPTKTLLHAAKLCEAAKKGERMGVRAEGVRLQHADVLQRKGRVVKKLTVGITAKLRDAGVTVVPGAAEIQGKDGPDFLVAVEGEVYAAKKLLVATGSVPAVPEMPGVAAGREAGFVLTSTELLDIPEVPQTLVVVGGGVVGLELASYFCTAGAHVTVVEMLGSIGGGIEAEVAAVLLKNLQKQGIRFCLSSRVTAVKPGVVRVENEQGTEELPAEKVLLCVGRRANCEGFGLETLGVETRQGAIVTNEHLCTNVPGVYAAGDVNGKSMLAHTAYREAEVAVHHMLGVQDAMQYDAVPSVVYTSPEVACVGETEESARAKGMDVTAVRLPLAYAGRYVAEVDAGDGICKMVADKNTRQVVGVQMIGSYASEMIYGAAMMIELALPLEQLQKVVFPHPTVSEILREGLFLL